MKRTIFKYNGELVGSCEGEMFTTDLEKLREIIAMELEVTIDEIKTEIIEYKELGFTCITPLGKFCYADIVQKEIIGCRATTKQYSAFAKAMIENTVDEISTFLI